MTIVWTQGADEDLEAVLEHIMKDNVSAAQRVTERIFNAAQSLSTFPFRGRLPNGTEPRELVVSPGPYILRYTVEGERVLIVSVRHGAQQFVH